MYVIHLILQPGSDSGCTAVVAILKDRDLYVANAGDSRCVLCREGNAFELSLDHKPEDEGELERIKKAGGTVNNDGRVNGGLNLSRALGDHAYKQNTSLSPQEQMISALPDIKHTTIDPVKDEFMILACDGIWNFMSSEDVVQFVRSRMSKHKDSLSKICEEVCLKYSGVFARLRELPAHLWLDLFQLFDHCLAKDTFGDGTGCDNMTAVIVRFPSSKSDTTNSTITEVCATKKRSLSPTEEINERGTEENNLSCKRPKTEATI